MNGAATMEVPSKAKNRAAIWSGSPTPGHMSRENHNLGRYTPPPDVHCSTTCRRRATEATLVSADRGVGGEDAVRTQDGVLGTETREAAPALAARTDLEIITLSEGIQAEKDKDHMTSLYVGSEQMIQVTNLNLNMNFRHRP